MNQTINGSLSRVVRSYNLRGLCDGDLLRAFRSAGDQDSFAELMSRHSRMIIHAARAVIGETSRAEDIAQATFLTLIRKAEWSSLPHWICSKR